MSTAGFDWMAAMAFGKSKNKKKQEAATERALLATELATLRSIMERYPPGSMLNFGSPTRCPECGDYGIVKWADTTRGACSNHCRVCRRDWVITARALQAYYLASVDAAAMPTPSVLGADEELPFLDELPATSPTPVRAAEPESPADHLDAIQAEQDGRPTLADYRVAGVQPEPVADHEVVESPPVDELVDEPADEPVDVPAPVAEAVPVTHAALPPPRAPADAPTDAPTAASTEPADVAVDLTEPLPTLRVLVVDDNVFDFAMFEELLEPFVSNGEVELEHRATRRQGEEAVRSFPFDLVLLDLDLHDTHGLTTVLEWNHRAGEPLPLIALIDEADPDLTQQTTAAGIQAVILKAHIEKLTTQGEAGQKRLHKLLRDTAARAADAPPDPRWRRSRGPALAREADRAVNAPS